MSCRSDNADMRLTEKGRQAGIVGDKRWKKFSRTRAEMLDLQDRLESNRFSSQEWQRRGFQIHDGSEKRSAYDMLRLQGMDVDTVTSRIAGFGVGDHYSNAVKSRVHIESTYAPYISIQEKSAQAFVKDEELTLPADLDYDRIFGLSMGEKEVLKLVRPTSIGMARRVEGVTPTGALRLLKHTRRVGLPLSTSTERTKPRESWIELETAGPERLAEVV